MTITTTRRVLTTLLVVATMLAGTVVPAFAVATGSASLGDSEVFAGSTSQVEVTVTNNAAEGGLPVLQPGGSSIDAVQILVDDAVVSPTTVTPPSGWTGDYDAARGTAYFFADEGSEIAPGASATFSLPSEIAPQSDDTDTSVIVQVSDNGGATSTNAGILDLAIRILEIVPDSVTIIKPVTTQAANLVTEQQDNAFVRFDVRNHADVDKSVDATASKDGGSSSLEAQPANVSVPAGQIVPVDIPVTFGAPGSLDILGEASSGSSDAVTDTFEGVTVQQAIALAYNDDLSPLAAVPGTTETFTLSVDKVGGPGGTLDTEFSFSDGTTIVTGTNSLGVGAANDTGDLTYTVDIPTTITDGEHPSTLTYDGVDDNGAIVEEVSVDLDDILLDRLQPILDLLLTPPASAVEGAEDAAGAGDDVDVSGTVTVQSGGACTQCDISDVTITFLDASGNATGTREGPDLSNSNGDVSGSFTMPADVPAGTVSVRLSATAQRADNLRAGTDTSSADVDILAPLGVGADEAADGTTSVDGTVATTGRDETGDFVDVPFSERIAFGGLATAGDWTVDGNTVTSVEYLNEGSSAGTDKIRLRLAQPLDRNASPTVAYQPAFGPLARAYDRVELDLADQALQAIDNIAPDILGIVSVSTYRTSNADTDENRVDQGSFDGIFHTRDRTPVVTVNNVAVGDTVKVFRDTNDDGVQQAGESTLGQVIQAQGSTVEVTLTDLGASETTLNISAYAIDASGNAGIGPTGNDLELDFTPPTIDTYTVSGSQVTVTFTEAVPVGRDAAFDWLVFSEGRYRPVDSVTNTDGDDTTRTLTFNSAVVPGDITAVRWESVTSDAGDDYADIARNEANAAGLEHQKP